MPDTAEQLAREAGLPERVVVGANGAYWRVYSDQYSMCPVSTDNDPIDVIATYERVVNPVPDTEPLVPAALELLADYGKSGVTQDGTIRTRLLEVQAQAAERAAAGWTASPEESGCHTCEACNRRLS